MLSDVLWNCPVLQKFFLQPLRVQRKTVSFGIFGKDFRRELYKYIVMGEYDVFRLELFLYDGSVFRRHF